MSANVESMFYVREAPWHGLGIRVEHALTANEALSAAGLDWSVIQKSIQTEDLSEIPGYKPNIRAADQRLLGVVSDRYKIVQNHEAFAFADELLGEGVPFKTAGSLQNGKKIWLLAKLHLRSMSLPGTTYLRIWCSQIVMTETVALKSQ
uniref:DUF932 domain-containing protein n=1 Tax=Paenibacillus polymyxa TaxID=1406 RepID=A0AAE9Q0T8_PAEPO